MGQALRWVRSHKFDPAAAAIADRHYNRRKVGSPQFVPPGRSLVLKTEAALWITSWPFAEYVRHAWPGAWVCSCFRNESDVLSSELILEAVAATRSEWPAVPALGMITFVDRAKTRSKRNPGYCYQMAGFVPCGKTKGGLYALQLLEPAMPPAVAPLESQLGLAV